MTPIPLAELRLDWRSHRSALWWLGLLYRRPQHFQEALEGSDHWPRLAVALRLSCHQVPYALFAICSFELSRRLGIQADANSQGLAEALLWYVEQVALGIVFGFVGGFSLGIVLGIVFRVVFGIAGWVAGSLAGGTAGVFALRFGIETFEIAFWLAIGLAVGIAVGLAEETALVFGVTFLYFALASEAYAGIVAALVAFVTTISKAYYQPLHPFFLWPKVRGSWYPYHPAAWDDECWLAFPGLDRLLVAYHKQEREAAEREIERLIDSYPSQRFQALRAKAILLAGQAGETRDLSYLDEIIAGLPAGYKGFLAQTRRLREMAHGIAEIQARIDTLASPFLREPLARLLCREIERFRDRVSGFRQPLAREFRTTAAKWLNVARQQLADAETVLEREPTRQVFRAGDPVDRECEAFVPRNGVSDEIERLMMLATGCPGIVLYGRRRTGKSTVLRNLEGFLPPQVLRANVSMQKPGALASLADLVTTLTGAVGGAVDGLGPTVVDGDLLQLFSSLEEANDKLEAADRRLLLSIDEYENLDRKIGEGVFPEDLLATLRESSQTHRRITWIFAGSHEITELPNARWASYLVSARTVEVKPFTAAETRLLLTEPLKYSKLWPKDDPTRPRFTPGFWGEGGIERIHAETGGWPHLVQLVAETVVDLLNDDQRSSADAEILERALDKAIVRGHTVLYELMRGESTLPGEWDYLAAFRHRSIQRPPDDQTVDRSLRRRLLVAEDGGEWQLRVPLMERWLRQRG